MQAKLRLSKPGLWGEGEASGRSDEACKSTGNAWRISFETPLGFASLLQLAWVLVGLTFVLAST